jgi:hypothetical protein
MPLMAIQATLDLEVIIAYVFDQCISIRNEQQMHGQTYRKRIYTKFKKKYVTDLGHLKHGF